MSTIRYIGVIISFAFFLFSIFRYKSGKLRRIDLFIFFGISLAIFLISLQPNIVNFITAPLTGGYEQANRLIAIIIVSNFIIYGLILKQFLRINSVDRNLGRLVEALAVSQYKEDKKISNIKKIIVVIPAYNEEENIGNVLKRIPEKIRNHKIEPLVVVDGATDNTEKVAREMGASVIVNKINRGGGAALRAGYQTALNQEAEIVVTLDADGQHRPEEIERLVIPIINNEVDFTSGSRILGKQEKNSRIRQSGIVFFNILISILLLRRITDCSNSFRALKVNELAKLDLKEDQFHSTELIIDAVKKDIRFKEVPVSVLKRYSGESKKPGSLIYGWSFFKTIMKTWFR